MAESSSISGAPPAGVVGVIAVSRVAPAAAPAAEREGDQIIKLSFFDTPWVASSPVQLVFLYELPSADDVPAAVRRLKESLAVTLALYLPLAGRLAYVPETRDVVLDCSDDDALGVAFVEAEGAGGMDVRRLAGDEAHDVTAFNGLVPELDVAVLPAPVLSVQATRLGGGGLAVGVSVHHAVADGHALARFLHAWASASREGSGSPVTESLGRPCYSRQVIVHPRADEFARERLHKVAPNLPTVNTRKHDVTQRLELARRTFYLSADAIRSLKQRINALASAEAAEASGDKPAVSTFAAVSALGWTAFVHSKVLFPGDDTHLPTCARASTLQVDAAYLGNCVRGCLASADAGDLLSDAGLLRAARAIQAGVREVEAAPLAGLETWLDRVRRLPLPRLANVAASPRYRVYEAADFGFGTPRRVEQVSMSYDGEMVLVGGRGPGEVQLSVSIHPDCVDAFKARILCLTGM
ncbi:hypothetical protein EJB05_22678, partial [Eragrostis curvula]